MLARGAVVVCLCVLLAGCYKQQMADQERYDPLEESSFFVDGMASRPVVEGTVARGELYRDTPLHTGMVDGEPVESFPVEVDRALLERGRERYDIFCSPCHARTGNGNGVVVQRGFRRPSSLHVDRLRQAPPGYFFDVITNGFGAMSSYASQVPARDRWAIIAYIRALQLSQQAPATALSDDDLERLGGGR